MTAVELITAASPADPVLDIALSHALLAEVASGRRPPGLRVFRPGPTVAFGRLDTLRPGFGRACAAARELGFTPLVRSVGGHAAVFDERCVVVERITHDEDATAGLRARFEDQSRRVRDALAALGADARIGELAGEYCPGPHSVNLGGRVKVAGIAQRIVQARRDHERDRRRRRRAAAARGDRGRLRGARDRGRPRHRGSAGRRAPGRDPARCRAALEQAYAEDSQLEPRALDPGVLASARELAVRHRVA